MKTDNNEPFTYGTVELYYSEDNSDSPVEDKEFKLLHVLPVVSGEAIRHEIQRTDTNIKFFAIIDDASRKDPCYFTRNLDILKVKR